MCIRDSVVSALSSLADIQQIQCIPYRRTGCHRKVLLLQSWLFNLYCLWVMRQVGIYTADLRLVYQVNKKQEFPADRWKMKISWKPLLKCMWCAILIAQWKHWYTKLERCVAYIFPVIGRVVPARTALSVLGVFLFILLYYTLDVYKRQEYIPSAVCLKADGGLCWA